MNVPKVFWVFFIVFQVVFGALVFVVTRSYYRDASPTLPSATQSLSGASLSAGGSATAVDLTTPRTPEELAQLADEHFSNRQYEAAAVLYEQLLNQDRSNVDLLNNLAITLHYLGRSSEALDLINQGIVADPGHQRIWLTRGFILSQTERPEEATSALNTAIEIDSTSAIADSARQMLSEIRTP